MSDKTTIQIESSDKHLVNGFNWAKQQALRNVFSKDLVGKWYESTLPGRDAFCMRDVSHESVGAEVLGLRSYTKNMLRKFAVNISASKDWATFWEINKYDRPAPVDYTDDKNFWYDLPANFDIVRASWREYQWTADPDYIEDMTFQSFYEHSVDEYVEQWDTEHSGVMESPRSDRFRGIPSYDEDWQSPRLIVADLLAAEYAGYMSYGRIQNAKGNPNVAAIYFKKAENLKGLYNSDWWNEKLGRHYDAVLQDHNFYSGYINAAHILPFWFDQIPEEGEKSDRELDYILRKGAHGVELRSYLPWIFYKYGRNDTAYHLLSEMIDPSLPRREYPEVSFSVIDDVVEGMMGISPDASRREIETLSRLTSKTAWVKLSGVPVFDNYVSVLHEGTRKTSFTNEVGSPVSWKASFPISIDPISNDPWRLDPDGQTRIVKSAAPSYLLVDGVRVDATSTIGLDGQVSVFVIMTVNAGETRTVQMP